MALVELTIEGQVAVIALNRPEKRNAIDLPTQHALIAVLREVAGDGSLRAAVLTATGADFCVGGDRAVVEQLVAGKDGFEQDLAALHRQFVSLLAGLDIPVIAAIEGAAFGVGSELAACCNIVLLGESARLGDPHVRFDRGPAPVTALLWPMMASRAIVAELLITGREVPAREALSIGLATRVVPDGTARAEALALAGTIAALPRGGVSEAKRALRLELAGLDRFYPAPAGSTPDIAG